MSVIRSAGLRGFRATVAELGGDAEAYARQSEFPVSALDADDVLVPEEAMATILEVAAADLDCPDLGLRIAARQDIGMLGALALAIQNSETLRDALECTTRYLFVHAPSMRLSLDPDPYGVPGVAALRYGVREGLEFPPQGADLSLGFVHRAITYLVGPYGLRGVDLPHPPLAPLTVYEDFFGVPVRTDRPEALLRAPVTLADRSLAGSDAHRRRLALAYLEEQSSGARSDLVTSVRAVVQQSLGTSAPEIRTTARLLDLHPRTLQRRLSEQGTSFARVLDEERRRAARRYLTGTRLPLGQIAALLGLSEQSALTRCCRRWWGVTPLAVRRGEGAQGEN
ncbi:AraC family transcriptional regulator [Streptomyces sp. SCSIO ZS0520]|uniref:AraC family transcriptional regulator n=1 Tax=Streptomyces sp. SCSIO ZS0520 TaxID=2892996 RepID=UPI0021DA0442|nr:AraC family transcriptional regulator [Streptomyces sp. SCSIO ZS0520]